MSSKSTKSAKTTDIRTSVVAAALSLAARRDWANVTLPDIADAAKISLADLSGVFDDRDEIIAAYSRMVDRDVLESYPDGVPGSSERDRLFDCLMERFDRLNDDRAALASIIRAACTDPKQMIIGLPGVGRSMTWTLEACSIDTSGWRGALRVLALSGIYLWVLRVWKDDDSADMAKTMAALDRALDKGESLVGTLGF